MLSTAKLLLVVRSPPPLKPSPAVKFIFDLATVLSTAKLLEAVISPPPDSPSPAVSVTPL